MLYHRGSKGSYDAWAEKVGDDAYRWENMLPFFKRTMQFSPNAERRPENTAAGVYDADAYSAEGGPLQVSLPAYVEPVSNYAPAVFEAMGLERQPGSSSGRLDGYAWWQYTVDPETGLRSSAESSLLQQAFGRPSLTTYINAQARNIVFNDTKATGVNVTINGQYPFVLSARKEVISAAGAWVSAVVSPGRERHAYTCGNCLLSPYSTHHSFSWYRVSVPDRPWRASTSLSSPTCLELDNTSMILAQ